MQPAFRLVPFLVLVILSGCATTPKLINEEPPLAPAATPITDVTAYVDAAALKQMGDKEKAEAASAQFYALQYGRTGAPRQWAGDRGASGEVLVGPPVSVNSLYCRNFTHTVNAGGQTFTKQAMACREEGKWSVVS